MSTQWWYRAFGEEFGPVDTETLRNLVRCGTVCSHDMVRCGTDGIWTRSSYIPELSSTDAASHGEAGLSRDAVPASDDQSSEISPTGINDVASLGSWTTIEDVKIESSDSSRVLGARLPDDTVTGASASRQPNVCQDSSTVRHSVDPNAAASLDTWQSLDDIPVSDMAPAAPRGSQVARHPRPAAAGSLPAPDPIDKPGPDVGEEQGRDSVETTEGHPPVSDATSTPESPCGPGDNEAATALDSEDVVEGSPVVSGLSLAINDATRDTIRKQQMREGRSGFGRPTRSRAAGGLREAPGRIVSAVASLIAAGVQPVFFLAEFTWRHRMVAAAVLLTTATASAAIILPQYWWTTAETYAELRGIHEEFEVLKTSGASETQWNEFRQRATRQTQTIVARLEPSATSDRKLRLELLWIARDYIPAMLSDPHDAPSASEQQCVAHLEQVERMIRRSEETEATSRRWAIPVVLAADGLLLIVGAVWLFRG